MAIPSSSSSSSPLGSSREQGARLLCCYLLLIPIVFILVFAPVFVYVDHRTSQKALLNFSVVVLIIVFSVMWRVYLRGTVGLRPPEPSERFTGRYHNERRRLGSMGGTVLIDRPARSTSSNTAATAAVYFSAISSSSASSSGPRHCNPLLIRGGGGGGGPFPRPGNAMIVHLTIPIDMDAHSHLNPNSFHPQIVRPWPDNPPPYHVAVDLPAPDVIRSDTRQSIVESPPPPYDYATENDSNRRNV